MSLFQHPTFYRYGVIVSVTGFGLGWLVNDYFKTKQLKEWAKQKIAKEELERRLNTNNDDSNLNTNNNTNGNKNNNANH